MHVLHGDSDGGNKLTTLTFGPQMSSPNSSQTNLVFRGMSSLLFRMTRAVLSGGGQAGGGAFCEQVPFF